MSCDTIGSDSPCLASAIVERQMPNAIGTRDDHLRRQSNKQTMLNDPSPPIKLCGQLRRFPDRAEGTVENQVPLIGPKWRAVAALSHGDPGAQGSEEVPLRMPSERDDLDRQRPVGAKHRRQLCFIDDDDLPATGLGHDLLVEQRPSTAFDEVQVRIDLVGAVDGQVHQRPADSG